MSDAVNSSSPRRTLRPRQRLRDSSDFRSVYDARNAWHGPALVVFSRPNGLPFSRMGVSVSRKHGPAVWRNRLKRVMREAFRLDQAELPAGFDYVLIPRQGVREFSTDLVRKQLVRFARERRRSTSGFPA